MQHLQPIPYICRGRLHDVDKVLSQQLISPRENAMNVRISARVAVGVTIAALALGVLGFHVQEGDAGADLDPGDAGFNAHFPPALAPLHQQAIDVAETYLFHGLVEHSPASVQLVLLDPNVERFELGRCTGGACLDPSDGDGNLRQRILGPGNLVITGIRTLRWFVECSKAGACEAIAFYDLEIDAFGPRPPVYIAERFRVPGINVFSDFTRCGAACFDESGLGHEVITPFE
jgi:hypothetical protein